MGFVAFLLHLAGLTFVFTYDDLSLRKIATQSQTFTGLNFDASNAVDGNTATCMRTNEIGHHSPYKTTWWKVDLGGVYSIYNVNILFKSYGLPFESRQRGRFAGFSLYVSNTDVTTSNDIKSSILCYKDGPQLPPLNFTTTCTEHGRYVIFYNERVDGVTYPVEYEIRNVYTELCEIIVQGCNQSGVYGRNCNITCPINCKDSICNIQNGSCIGCKSGRMGQSCSKKCSEGLYGDSCSQQCKGHCRGGITCNHVTGQCDRGCDSGWTGSLCDKECDDGTYGYDCVNNCSVNCLNNSKCNKQTGHCDEGCDLGNNCSKGTSFLQRTETTPASTSWIVGFSISLSVNVILISVILIMLWRFLIKGQPTAIGLQLCRRCTSNENRIEASDQIIK